jgi:flagellar hook-length control protein FliK
MRALAKAGGVTQRGPELTTGAEVRTKTEGQEKKQALSKTREAAPAPEREQAADILKQVRLHLSPETRSATLNLKPAELGRVSIRIVVDGDQVQALVRAESPEALQALEQYMPELQASLGDHGFQEADIDLSLGFEGEERESADDLQAKEIAPTKIHRLFQSTEAVDYFA